MNNPFEILQAPYLKYLEYLQIRNDKSKNYFKRVRQGLENLVPDNFFKGWTYEDVLSFDDALNAAMHTYQVDEDISGQYNVEIMKSIVSDNPLYAAVAAIDRFDEAAKKSEYYSGTYTLSLGQIAVLRLPALDSPAQVDMFIDEEIERLKKKCTVQDALEAAFFLSGLMMQDEKLKQLGMRIISVGIGQLSKGQEKKKVAPKIGPSRKTQRTNGGRLIA